MSGDPESEHQRVRPAPVARRRKRQVADGLKLGEIVVLRQIDQGATQATVCRSAHYSRSGVAALLRRLRALYGVESTPDLLRHPDIRRQLTAAYSADARLIMRRRQR